MTDASELPERESMEFDVVIVGAGPAGLSAAIRLKQINPDLTVVVLEKGAEVGAHILSGAVVDPIGIDRLLPGWREEEGHPFKTEVTDDHFLFLGPAGSIRLPNFLMPPLMSNHGNYIVSLGNVCRWLAEKAEALGVEIYPGFAATEVLYNDEGAVIGVATGDMGIEKNGEPGPNYTRGMALLGKYVLIGEGVRGSLAKQLIAKFDLARNSDVPKFGIGIKELWEVKPENHRQGLVQHSFGWPLGMKTGGGSFLYHLEDNLVAVGFVVHLNYKNPYLYPFEEFQRFKTHPAIRGTFEGGKRISYGARAITEGGWQSVPKLTFPGGALIGCSAGFVNVPRIKGSHNAVLSGMLAADRLAPAIAAGRGNDEVIEIENEWRSSDIGKDLKRVRNVKPLWSKFGTAIGVALGGLDMWTNQLFGFSFFGTLKHGKTDAQSLEPAAQHQKIDYPKPDGVLTFDRLSSVFLSNTNHEEDQPAHLVLRDPSRWKPVNWEQFRSPESRYCPAAVYEAVGPEAERELKGTPDPEALGPGGDVEAGDGGARLVINAQNCVHCKTCDIKDPSQNIDWQTPEGGGGPNYI
ncbi:4Fe-4S dicluster domain-containing protein, partial [Rhizobium sp.]|uniref:electron transfer flavoprotein-ubiquinone oxidoreductase n=1 Tax=Rhizobium sp. TaxID=391 RepID=UPI003F7E6B7E